MCLSERALLLNFFKDRRSAIVEAWFDAIADTGFTVFTPTEIRNCLGKLTDQIMGLLLADTLEHQEAREVGAALASLHLLEPETLGRTLKVLTNELGRGLGAEQILLQQRLHQRLAVLLPEVAVGFMERARQEVLREQESIRSALLHSRERAQRALRKSEAGLAEAQRIAHLGHWELDLVHDELHWSAEIFRIFDVRREEFGATLDAFRKYVHSEDLEMVDRRGQAAIRGEPTSFEHRIVRPGGEIRVVYQRVAPSFDEEGHPEKLVGTIQDITERKLLEERLEHQALHDSLTGLANRTLFSDRLEHALARAQRREPGMALLFLDLDNFKYVNDSLGHSAGDRLLVGLAERLKKSARPEDTIARLGGDEYTLLLEDIEDVDYATRVAERVMEELRDPFYVQGHELFARVSIGIAFSATGKEGAGALLRQADLALYDAKRAGKARYAIFDPSAELRSIQRLRLENDLRRAIEQEEFVVHHQPLISLKTQRIVGMEALVRWEHPQRGLLSPEEFVPVAEEIGLITSLGRWVLYEACRQMRQWQERYPYYDPPLNVSVNLSGKQLQTLDVVEDVKGALRESGLEPESLTLEITESVSVENAERHVGTLQELRDVGVRLAIDDFGTGYSSLSYLRRLPASVLKVAGPFVEGIGTGSEDEILLAGIIGIAQSLRLSVAAEGIETAQQAARLKELGCDLAQGHYFYRALPGEEASRYLEENSSL